MKVNKLRDFVERNTWTLLELLGGISAGEVLNNDPLSWWTPFYVFAITGAKVLIAQRAGRHDDGAAIPGGVIEPH
jgi:hypothetical protein